MSIIVASADCGVAGQICECVCRDKARFLFLFDGASPQRSEPDEIKQSRLPVEAAERRYRGLSRQLRGRPEEAATTTSQWCLNISNLPSVVAGKPDIARHQRFGYRC